MSKITDVSLSYEIKQETLETARNDGNYTTLGAFLWPGMPMPDGFDASWVESVNFAPKNKNNNSGVQKNVNLCWSCFNDWHGISISVLNSWPRMGS